MKKALVLGVLAIFALNIANAQDRQTTKPAKGTKTAKTEKAKIVKPKAASWDAEKDRTATCDPKAKDCKKEATKEVTETQLKDQAAANEKAAAGEKAAVNNKTNIKNKTAKAKTEKTKAVGPTTTREKAPKAGTNNATSNPSR